MHATWIICRREVTAFFDSLTAYIILVVLLGLSGFFTWLSADNIFYSGQASLQSFFGISYWTLFFFIPAITMRMLAEEHRAGTIELLATKPVSDFQIVFGKWLACFILILASLLPTIIYYITIVNLGNVDQGGVIGGYFALIMISSAYISIGMLASGLANNQIVVFVLSLFIAFFFQLLFDMFTPLLPQALANITYYLSFTTHFTTMARGVISIENIVYLAGMSLFGMILATAAIRKRAWL